MLPLFLFALVALVFAFVVVMWLLRPAIYLLIGAGYLLYWAAIAAFWTVFAAGWLIWQGCRGIDRVVGKYAPPIAARYHQWCDSETQNRPPVRRVADSEIVHYGYGRLNPARVRELQPRTSSALARR